MRKMSETEWAMVQASRRVLQTVNGSNPAATAKAHAEALEGLKTALGAFIEGK